VGLKGEPQVKSSTRRTEIHAGKGKSRTEPGSENTKFNWIPGR